MRILTRTFRFFYIQYILIRYNIDEIIFQTQWFYPFRYLIYFNPYYWRKEHQVSRGIRIRLALEKLGPIFVKVGQMLSTRRDIVPDDIALELARLQDRVPPFSTQMAIDIIETSLNAPISECFAEFNDQALASASISQVHVARLKTGEEVVVKVLRPDIEKKIKNDTDLMLLFARFLEKYFFTVRQFKPSQIVMEVAQTLYDELDLLREGANASQLKRNFKFSPLLYIPTIYWPYSRSNVLVMERIKGIPIHNMAGLQQAGIDLKLLADHFIEVFFTQVFRDSFFHADLHPGNIFVAEENKELPSLICVDFGIVGSLNQNDQRYLAENMIAFFKRDYQRVAELHIACGWLSPDTRIDQFEGAIRSVSEPIFEQPLRNISFGQLLLRLFQVARRFEINIQPQLVLLQKTLLNVESLSRELAPDLDLWQKAGPQIEKWLKKQVGAGAFFKRIYQNLPLWSEQLPEIPSLMYTLLDEKKKNQERLRYTKMQGMISKKKTAKSNPFLYFLMGIIFTLFIHFFIKLPW